MSATLLLRRCASPLAVARIRASAAPCSSLSVFASSLSSCSPPSRPHSLSRTSRSRLLLSRPLEPLASAFPNGKSSPSAMQLKRHYSPGRNPWQSDNNWKSTLKTGAMVALGTGALIASTSVAFGLIIAGAAGFGLYTLYQKFVSPLRSQFGSKDPFGGVNANVDALNEMFSGSRKRGKSTMQDELDSLVKGMPLVVRTLVKTMFSFAGRAMQSSMQRAGELRRRTNDYVQTNKRVRDQMGENVSVGGPEQWMESTVNGVGRIEAVFPVSGAYGAAQVTMKASIGQGGSLSFQELKYRNRRTGEVIDLLRNSSVGGRRKTVIDADYVDLDNENNRSSRW